MNTESNKRSRDCNSVLKNTSILCLLCWDLKKIPRWRERPNHEREPNRLNLITTEVNCGFALSSDKLHYKSYPFIMIPLPLKKVCSTKNSEGLNKIALWIQIFVYIRVTSVEHDTWNKHKQNICRDMMKLTLSSCTCSCKVSLRLTHQLRRKKDTYRHKCAMIVIVRYVM